MIRATAVNKKIVGAGMFLVAGAINAVLLALIGKGLEASPVSIYRSFFLIVIAALATIAAGEILNRITGSSFFPSPDVYAADEDELRKPGNNIKPLESNEKICATIAFILFALFMQIGPDK